MLKSEKPEESVENLKEQLDTDKVDVFNNGVKVYVVPKMLSKGKAIDRLREKLNPELIISAGDSEFDITMLNSSDVPIAPKDLADTANLPEKTIVVDEGIFSEKVLERVLQTAKYYSNN